MRIQHLFKIIFVGISIFILCSCSDKKISSGSGVRHSVPGVLTPVATGEKLSENGPALIDYSDTSKGYVMVSYNGETDDIRMQMIGPNENVYTYSFGTSEEFFPLTEGNGEYTVKILKRLEGKKYLTVLSQSFEVNLENEFLPFLYPNHYVWFTENSQTVKKGYELVEQSRDDIEIVADIYNYVVKNISYDYQKASDLSFGYAPDVDKCLSEKKGICFDYAAIMATMLRSQGIPTILQVGWAGKIYHAWISVYIEEIGWINGIIQFDGTNWKRLDPTFASTDRQSKEIMDFINSDTNYTLKYRY